MLENILKIGASRFQWALTSFILVFAAGCEIRSEFDHRVITDLPVYDSKRLGGAKNWLDDDRLLFVGGSEIPKGGDLSARNSPYLDNKSIYIWNLKTGEIKTYFNDAPNKPVSLCYHEGRIYYELADDSGKSLGRYFYGKMGEEKEYRKDPDYFYKINWYDCELRSVKSGQKQSSISRLGEDQQGKFVRLPILMKKHGQIKFYQKERYNYFIDASSGRKSKLIHFPQDSLTGLNSPKFHQHLGMYSFNYTNFIGKPCINAYFLNPETGENSVDCISRDRLNGGGFIPLTSELELLAFYGGSNNHNLKKAGMYIKGKHKSFDKKLIKNKGRLAKGIIEGMVLSPNKCRVAFNYSTKVFTNSGSLMLPVVKVIDICRGEGK